jgi:hypothetical protein
VVRNKSRLVAQGYSQKEVINYKEAFAPVARLEAIRILLAFYVPKGFKLHQIDVKSAFLNLSGNNRGLRVRSTPTRFTS